MDREAFKRQAKVVDMMLTMHSILASRYRRRALLSLLAISTVLVALTFIDPQVLIHLAINTETARIVIGVCSTLVFSCRLSFFWSIGKDG